MAFKNETEESRKAALKDITEKLEKGITDMMNSEDFKKYLITMSRFHSYSFSNTILIAMQKPDATLVAGYTSWKDKFHRNVLKGEKGIKIIAPCPSKIKVEKEILDKNGESILDENGDTKKEWVQTVIPKYKVVSVFDISQTDGEPLPTIGVEELSGNVNDYNKLKEALISIAPVPVEFNMIDTGAKGYFSHSSQKIVINEGMSEAQTLKTMIHELAHSLLHDTNKESITKEQQTALDLLNGDVETNLGTMPVIDYLDMMASRTGYDDFESLIKDGLKISGYESITEDILKLDKLLKASKETRNTKEVQAESVAFSVCNYLGLDTSEYSFGYIAGWSADKDLSDLKESLSIIRTTANQIINGIENFIFEREKNKELINQLENNDDIIQKPSYPKGFDENRTKKQLKRNLDNILGGYLNGMYDNPENYPKMTLKECIDYCIPDIYDQKSDGLGTTWYEYGICQDLKFLGNDYIHEQIEKIAKAEGILSTDKIIKTKPSFTKESMKEDLAELSKRKQEIVKETGIKAANKEQMI